MQKRKESAILKSINKYAKAYKNLEDIQCATEQWLPKGDQKTGVIGEFYAFIYLRSKNKNAKIEYANHSQKGWDIEIDNGANTKKVQIKTVSGYSKTCTISPIHLGWDELCLVYLDKQFDPKGFWIISDSDIVNGRDELKGKKMPIPGKSNTGSKVLKKKTCLLSELTNSIECLNQG
ncbi:hypothetical protein MNBD_NITROSPINAE04-1656 [hydrothermal vent metagenome]|uniref:Uncharacterized protein n=1 Tax=hydrothermal vent metagenome TaxID=652676 RepID=A0A3B1BKC8_9ZZZZ